MVNDELNINIT